MLAAALKSCTLSPQRSRLLVGQVPVCDLMICISYDAFFGAGLGDWRGDDYRFAAAPVRRSRDGVGVGGLQGIHHAQQFVDVAAAGERVVQQGTDVLFGIDEENRSHRRCVIGWLMHHAEQAAIFWSRSAITGNEIFALKLASMLRIQAMWE